MIICWGLFYRFFVKLLCPTFGFRRCGLPFFWAKCMVNANAEPLICLADFGSKQDTVKFVQDTSKFWYKPDISRDQGKYWPSCQITHPCVKGLHSMSMTFLTLAYLCIPLWLNSHRSAEGQRAGLIHCQRQPFISWGIWFGSEGGHTPSLGVTAE